MDEGTRWRAPGLRRRGAVALLAAAGVLAGAPHAAAAQARLPGITHDSGLIAYDDDGLRLHSPDRRRQLKIRGYVTADVRFLLNDTSDAAPNAFTIRRSRVFFDANLNPWMALRVMFDAGPLSGPTALQDAFLDVGLGGSWWLRAGKQKTPGGLERYTSISAILLPERSVASNLQGSRDEGFLLTGDVLHESVEVALGVFNGVADGGATQDTDANDAKDYTWRVWWRPVRHKVAGSEQGFGFGVNGTTGVAGGPPSVVSQLPTFKTQALATWFSYLESGGARAAGSHTRTGVYASLNEGPVGAAAEWYGNSQVVARGTTVVTVPTTGWLLSTQVTLTGEPSTAEGVTPAHPFDPAAGHWGALQAGVRASGVRIGDAAFPAVADPAVSARAAVELGAGVNWFLNHSSKMQVAYEHTAFDGGAHTGDRRPESYVQVRWQAYF